MTEETVRLINSLKEKALAIQHKVIKLKNENVEIVKELERLQIECDENKVKLSELGQKYKALKIAKSLGNADDTDSLKKQINAMVREIDTCIELIDE